jgi:hypothetical protein
VSINRYAEIHIALTGREKSVSTVTNCAEIFAVSNRMEPHFSLEPTPEKLPLQMLPAHRTWQTFMVPFL